jgi:peptidoglycan hydrolase-like protein with peptidoglycan-binding domain
MTTHRLAACLVLALAASPAAAQTAPQLSFEQPLAPSGVRAVQERLREMGGYPGPADGVWGDASAAALRQFQMNHGLQATGQLNQATAAILNLAPAELLAASPGPPQEHRLSSAEVRNLQVRLRQLGYYQGPGDGIWGPGMQAALQRFQQSSGLQVTGRLNAQSATAMGLNPDDLTQPAH